MTGVIISHPRLKTFREEESDALSTELFRLNSMHANI